MKSELETYSLTEFLFNLARFNKDNNTLIYNNHVHYLSPYLYPN